MSFGLNMSNLNIFKEINYIFCNLSDADKRLPMVTRGPKAAMSNGDWNHVLNFSPISKVKINYM